MAQPDECFCVWVSKRNPRQSMKYQWHKTHRGTIDCAISLEVLFQVTWLQRALRKGVEISPEKGKSGELNRFYNPSMQAHLPCQL